MIRTIWTVAAADLTLEFRRGAERLLTMILFGGFSAVILRFTVFAAGQPEERVVSGGAWMVFFFAATLGLGRAFVAEKEHGAFDALLLAPVPQEAVYLGKALSAFVLVFAAQCAAWGAFALFFRLPAPPGSAAILALAALALAALGTLLGSLSAHTKRREMLFPVLFFPLALPVVMTGAGAWEAALAGAEAARHLQILGACAILYLTVGVLLFEHAARE
jgi:heme exporter protein B